MMDSVNSEKSPTDKGRAILSSNDTRPTSSVPDQTKLPRREATETNTSRSPPKMDQGAKVAVDNLGKSLRSRAARRSLSGIPLTCLFESKFKHFKAYQTAQREANGLNFLLAPPSGAIYRSSMPVTAIGTPLFSGHGLKFNQQTLHSRLLAASQSTTQEDRQGQSLRPFQPNSDIREEPESQVSYETNDRQSNTSGPRTRAQQNRAKNSEKDRS